MGAALALAKTKVFVSEMRGGCRAAVFGQLAAVCRIFGPSDLEPKLRKKAKADPERDRSRAGQLDMLPRVGLRPICSETSVVSETRFFLSESGLIGLTVVPVAAWTEWSLFPVWAVGVTSWRGTLRCECIEDIVH